MGIWREILVLAANGNTNAAREKLALEVPQALVTPFVAEDGSLQQGGPVPKAIRSFAVKLPPMTQARLRLYELELADYIVDDVMWKIEQSIRIVEICALRPGAPLDDLVAIVPWTKGLKRSDEQKREDLASLLRSMLEQGVPLPEGVRATIGEVGKPWYGFDEIAYGASPTRIRQSWDDFKKDLDMDAQFVSINESESGVAAEGVDFGTITVSRLPLEPAPSFDFETEKRFEQLARRLEKDIPALLERMHTQKPANGYWPIAWHCVFWIVLDELEGLNFVLEVRDPFCDVDQDLADLIVAVYPDVVGTSRPTILRRRKDLYGACRQLIVSSAEETIEHCP
jgi:hypothetical protein